MQNQTQMESFSRQIRLTSANFVPLKSLVFHPLNDEIYILSDLSDLKASISEVGLLTPLVVDEHNQVISGNRRLKCLQELGWEKVPITRVNVGDSDPAILIVHHNKQRKKTYQELVNECKVLSSTCHIGQGKRSDLTYGISDVSEVSSKKRNKTARDVMNRPLFAGG